jgi:hypothetical protein
MKDKTMLTLHDSEIDFNIKKLIQIFGEPNIEQALKKYNKSMLLSPPIYREFHLIGLHPWFHGLNSYLQAKKKGKSIKRHLTDELIQIANDSCKLQQIFREAPSEIKAKFRKDLLDPESARAYLFEINIASKFKHKGFNIDWELGKNIKIPEFSIYNPEVFYDKIQIECKLIKHDKTKKIKRKDFYNFCDKLLFKLAKFKVSGEIQIKTFDKFPSNTEKQNDIAHYIFDLIKNKNLKGQYRTDNFVVSLNIAIDQNILANLDKLYQEMLTKRPHNAEACIFASSKNHIPKNPISIICESAKSGNVLKGIKDEITGALKTQLIKNKSSIVFCHLSEIDDFEVLSKNSGLSNLADYILNNKDYRNLHSLVFSSDLKLTQRGAIKFGHSPIIQFYNTNCEPNFELRLVEKR